jgi:DNA-binding MarR family transcriptional regulator
MLLDCAKRYPSMDLLTTEAYLHVVRTGTYLQHCVERKLARLGTSHGRFMILALLANLPGKAQPVSTLARMLGVTMPTVSSLITGMARDGLVRRVLDPEDRRLVRVELLPDGLSLHDALLPGLFRDQDEIMAGLDETEMRVLITLLAKVRLDAGPCAGEREAREA